MNYVIYVHVKLYWCENDTVIWSAGKSGLIWIKSG